MAYQKAISKSLWTADWFYTLRDLNSREMLWILQIQIQTRQGWLLHGQEANHKDWEDLSLVLSLYQWIFLFLESVRYCQLPLNTWKYVGVPGILAYLWLARMTNEWERFCPWFTKARQCWNISLLEKKTLLRSNWGEYCSLDYCQICYGYEPYRIFVQNKEKRVFSKPDFLYMCILLQNKKLPANALV